MEHLLTFRNLGVSLAVGLLIGLERGWRGRALVEGGRFAGLRTFGLLGFFGGVAGFLAVEFSPVIVPTALIVIGAFLLAGYWQSAEESSHIGLTTAASGVLTFALGALAARGHLTVAGAGAVVTAVVLGSKEALHGWVERLEQKELAATLKLLLVSVVILPILPNQGYGPYGVLNPYQLWWAVVLIGALSFAGYAAVRIVGSERGLPLTGIFGGLASSTATTAMLARLAKERPAMTDIAAASVIAACGVMFIRMTILIGVIQRELLISLWLPFVLMFLSAVAGVWWFWRKPGDTATAPTHLDNPLELGTGIKFGALLGGILLLAKVLEDLVGEAGVLALAAVSGLVDVDAITLSIGKLVDEGGLGARTGALAVILAAGANMITKAVLTQTLCGGPFARKVAVAFAGILIAGIGGFAVARTLL